jgi:hypothetical protein
VAAASAVALLCIGGGIALSGLGAFRVLEGYAMVTDMWCPHSCGMVDGLWVEVQPRFSRCRCHQAGSDDYPASSALPGRRGGRQGCKSERGGTAPIKLGMPRSGFGIQIGVATPSPSSQ